MTPYGSIDRTILPPTKGLTPSVQKSRDWERHERIAKRRPNELRTALVQFLLGMARNKWRTGAYRIMERYSRMKSHKGSGRTIVATARQLSENQPYDEARMRNLDIRRTAMETEGTTFDVA